MADAKETLDTIVKDVVEGDKKEAEAILDSLRAQRIKSLSDLGNLNAKRLEETLDDAKIKPPKTRADLEDKLKEYIKKDKTGEKGGSNVTDRLEAYISKLEKQLAFTNKVAAELLLSFGGRFSLDYLLVYGDCSVFTGYDLKKGGQVVIKYCPSSPLAVCEQSIWEHLILSRIVGCKGVPQVLAFEENSDHVMLVETPFGKALDAYAESMDTTSLSTILLLWASQLVELLCNIHSLGIIHRDLNPSNIIFVPESNQLCLIDFGIAFIVGETFLGGFSGTFLYASQRQRAGKHPTFQDDFHSLCYTLFALEMGIEQFSKLEPRPSFNAIKQRSAVVQLAYSKWKNLTIQTKKGN